ncbi:MAG TPA: shikimate kinase [Flavobacterium sp.]|nr:shikimate kinase [Flavobacterium sp.]
MQKIILVGYMGSGKTTIGKNLSLLTGLPFVDLDTYIEEKENLSIQEIFNTKGEIYFRKQEHNWLNELLNLNTPIIISLGGGTPCYANNHLLLQNNNVLSFYLKANITTLVNRLKDAKNRPLLNNIDDLPSFIAQHLFERSYFYNFSQYKIDVNNKKINNICNEILEIINLKN